MKILFLTHTFPYPLNEGTRVLIYNLLAQLAPRHEIHLICLNDQPVSAEELRIIQNLGLRSIQVIPHDVPKSMLARLLNVLRDPIPFCVRQFESEPLRRALREFFKSQTVDVVHAEYISSAVYRDEFRNVPAVFYPHDAVSMLFERNASAETSLARRYYTYFQWRKVIRFEHQALAGFERTIVVSEADRKYLAMHAATSRVRVVPVGIDCDHFAPRPAPAGAAPAASGTILFRGVMNFLPNDDAARHFYEDIFPDVKKKVPGARFVVAGNAPSSALTRAAAKDPSLTVTGFVKDIRDPMAEADVVVCPMRIGSGIKIKILESLAMGKAVVATPLACSGLEVKSGQHLIIAESPQEFASQVLQILKDPDLRKRLGTQGMNLVRELYPWNKIAARFETVYQEAVSPEPEKPEDDPEDDVESGAPPFPG